MQRLKLLVGAREDGPYEAIASVYLAACETNRRRVSRHQMIWEESHDRPHTDLHGVLVRVVVPTSEHRSAHKWRLRRVIQLRL